MPGALGNALFFVVIGYTWAGISEGTNFLGWYKKKVERIWIPTIFTNIVYILLLMQPGQYGICQFIRIFIYPNKSWFCGAILLYAIGYFVIAKRKTLKSLGCAVAILVAVYLGGYLFLLDKSEYNLEGLVTGGVCRLAHYALCMLAGYTIKVYGRNIKNKKGNHFVLVGMFLFVGAYAGKYIMEKSLILLQFQVVIQLMNLLSAILIFTGLMYKENNGEYIVGSRYLIKLVKKISEYSWELYLVQTLILPMCANYCFPFNLVLALILIVMCAYILKAICRRFYKIIGV